MINTIFFLLSISCSCALVTNESTMPRTGLSVKFFGLLVVS